MPRSNNNSNFRKNVTLDCGWGTLIFGETFESNRKLANALKKEKNNERNIAYNIQDPHILLTRDPQNFFLDPSNSYRLSLDKYTPIKIKEDEFYIREALPDDIQIINKLYKKNDKPILRDNFLIKYKKIRNKNIKIFVAHHKTTNKVIGVIIGVDHVSAYNDANNGASIWSLTINLQSPISGVKQALINHIAEYFKNKKRSYVEFLLLYDDEKNINFFKKIGFEQIQKFCIKNKTSFNENYFIGDNKKINFNPLSAVIVHEARKRGIKVEPIFKNNPNYFKLSFGGTSIKCFESLTELTNAIIYKFCDDKNLFFDFLNKYGFNCPKQIVYKEDEYKIALNFLNKHKKVVIKPADGTEGKGISVGVTSVENFKKALIRAKRVSSKIIIEEMVDGIDIRIVVIGGKIIAAAKRLQPIIVGTGRNSIRDLIRKQSHRRSIATDGESKIPLDGETKRCVLNAGYSLDDILPIGEKITVRNNANVSTGGTIHDITDQLSNELKHIAIKVTKALNIPVVGLDFIVPSIEGSKYSIIEANSGLALVNHEPQPVVEKYIDFLFPQTIK